MLDLSSPYYKTKDLQIASILVTSGFNIVKLERSGKICFFIFKNTFDLKNALIDYWNGALRVDPKLLFIAYRELKNRIFDNAYE